MASSSQLPDVSVIIATYNVESYVARAIESALFQISTSSEIIIVDDASTDKTVAVIERNPDPRIRLFKRAVNGGPSVARNEALLAATQPWIAILDGDDAFLPGRLSRCIGAGIKLSADIIVDNILTFDEATGTEKIMFRPQHFKEKTFLDLPTFILGNSSFLGGASLGYMKPIFSRKFLIKHVLMYDARIKIGEDYLLLADALASGAKCVILQIPGYRYTVRNGSISHRLLLGDVKSMQEADRAFSIRFKLDGESRAALRKRNFFLWEAYYFAELVNAIKQKNFPQVLKIVVRRPTTLIHLREAVTKRLKRAFQ